VRRSDSPAVPSVRPEVAPLDAVALGRDVAARMAGRVVRRPAFWIAVAAAAAGVYWIFLRSR
jgi:hypothetical protein